MAKKNKKNFSSDRLQQECFRYTWNKYPETRGLVWHTPNGGKRNAMEAAKFKAMGVIAGIPDLLCLWKGKLYAFEIKVDGDRQSEAQKEVEAKLQANGADCYIIKNTPDEFVRVFDEIMGG
jgi:hypothetical protein